MRDKGGINTRSIEWWSIGEEGPMKKVPYAKKPFPDRRRRLLSIIRMIGWSIHKRDGEKGLGVPPPFQVVK